MAEVLNEITAYARGELAKAAAQAGERGVTARQVVIQGKPATEVIRYAKEQAIDMIVLGTHGRGVLDHALFGSTTERVMRKAPCPVLTCRLAEHEFVDEQ
jgi:nucleotide-binding universal stress UspA family protein